MTTANVATPTARVDIFSDCSNCGRNVKAWGRVDSDTHEWTQTTPWVHESTMQEECKQRDVERFAAAGAGA